MPRPPSNQVTPGFRPGLLPENGAVDPMRSEKSAGSSRVEDDENAESDTEDIIKNMKLSFFDKVRIKLMSVEEKEAFLIEKIETEKKKRQAEKHRPCNSPSKGQ